MFAAFLFQISWRCINGKRTHLAVVFSLRIDSKIADLNEPPDNDLEA